MGDLNISQASASESEFRKFSWFRVPNSFKAFRFFIPFWNHFLETSVMKRIKRFVLAQSGEKDPIWKSSDNLLAGIVRMNSENNNEEDKEDSKTKPPTQGETAAGLT